MSGIRPYLSHVGPNTYEVSAAVKGGMLIAPTTGGKVGKAGALSLKVLGVAEGDAKPFVDPVSTDADGFETINVSPLPDHVAVGFGRYVVTYAADAAFGEALVAAANGTVTPVAAITTPTPGDVTASRAIIGYCDEPGGVVVATNPKGLANISR